MEEVKQNLVFIEKHLHEALDAMLNGTCKTKGIARLEAALCTLMEVKEQLEGVRPCRCPIKPSEE